MKFNDLIKKLQEAMNEQGETLKPDGVLGNKTIEALQKYDVQIIVSKPSQTNRNGLLSRPIDWVRGELGVSEIPGKQDNPRIRWYHTFSKNIGAKEHPDEVAWCSSFLNACADQTGMLGTGSALASSWINYGLKKSFAEEGDIIVVRRKDGGLHVTLANEPFNPQALHRFQGIGGNQSNKVCVTNYATSSIIAIRGWVPKP